MRQKVMVIDDTDKQFWELVTNVPRVHKNLSFVCVVLNFFLPGFGTLTAACSANENVSKTQMGMALLQFLTAFILVGFVLAQYWSYLLVTKALDSENSV
tara:strand:+ start:75 stop:371 length:297 start_codon:yes stop_codon:yes gene_type:complete